jgi:hypothetical protein
VRPEHDFGPVLARGQELHHEFLLRNPTDRPIRLLDARANTPCCSAVGQRPEVIPPGGTAALPVVFRPGTQTTRKRVTFAVQTDNPARPWWSLAVSASMTAEIEVRPVAGQDASLPIGAPGHQRFQVICRRVGDEGRDVPEAVEVAPPLVAALGPTRLDRLSPLLTEATRDLVVTLPASREPGPRRVEVRLKWADGLSRDMVVTWKVTPLIDASPSELILREGAGPASRIVLLRAADRPFRILEVTGPSLAGPPGPLPTGPERLHALRLDLDPARAGAGAMATDVRIVTDHPDQPALILGVLVVPEGRPQP